MLAGQGQQPGALAGNQLVQCLLVFLGEDAAHPFETGLDIDAVGGAGVVFAGQLHLAIARRDQTQAVADRLPVVMLGLAARIPEIALVPGNRTVAATGQANRPGAQVGTDIARSASSVSGRSHSGSGLPWASKASRKNTAALTRRWSSSSR